MLARACVYAMFLPMPASDRFVLPNFNLSAWCQQCALFGPHLVKFFQLCCQAVQTICFRASEVLQGQEAGLGAGSMYLTIVFAL